MKTRTFYLLNFFATCLLAVALYFNFVHKEDRDTSVASSAQKRVAQSDTAPAEHSKSCLQEANQPSASRVKLPVQAN